MLQELKREQRQFVADYYHGAGRQTIERRRDMAKRRASRWVTERRGLVGDERSHLRLC